MIFKYLPPHRISVLNDFRIRFTQMSELNDPFESALLVNAESEFNKIDPREVLLSIIEEGNFHPNSDQEEKELEAAIEELREEWKEKITPSNIGRELMTLLNKAQGVLSLSRTNSSLLMWAHYTDSHRGFVIGLDDTHPFFHGEDFFGNLVHPKNVIYSSNRYITNIETLDAYQQMLCHKSIEWSYEEEVRIFRIFGKDFNSFEMHKKDQIHLFHLPPECIKEIYIGANASAELRKNIRKVVNLRKLNVRIFDATISNEKYEIQHRKIIDEFINYQPKCSYVGSDYNFPLAELGFIFKK